MTDRRLLRSNGRVAHVSLHGQIRAARFVEGEVHQVATRVAALVDASDGNRDRELLFGQDFTVLEVRDGHAFGFAARDGYVGYVSTVCLARRRDAPTHVVSARQTCSKASPDLKARNEVMILCHGSQVRAHGQQGDWAEIDLPTNDLPTNDLPSRMFVPAVHLTPLGSHATDPVAVAELYLGAPYLWGGNSSLGIDCSGLVQAACLACGIACPGDSDLQAQALGTAVTDGGTPQRSDLLFWKGHVAMAVDDTRLIHANAHHMAVAHEPILGAIDRIRAQGGGPVTAHRQLSPTA